MKQVLRGYGLKEARTLLKPAIQDAFERELILQRKMSIDEYKITVTIEYERLKKQKRK